MSRLVSNEGEEVRLHGTTLEQRHVLVAAYKRGGNMAAAMREAGIRSPRTAYLWWRRYEQNGDEGLIPRSRARKSQHTVPEEIAADVRDLRRMHPDWGRRRIAREIQAMHGVGLVSPAGVEAVLRRSGLWMSAQRSVPPASTVVAVPPRPSYAEIDAMLPLVVSGIRESLRCRAASCVAILGDRVWNQLESDRYRWSRLLADPEIGPLLLRSRVELGRCLMNTGRWREAARVLEETLGWLQRAAPEITESASPDPSLGIWLRRHDAWLETYQYLGIVLRGRAPGIARGYLDIALAAIRSSSRRLVPLHPVLSEGNLERDVARHMLRVDDTSESEIARHLHSSRDSLENVGDQAMLAATDMTWANLLSRQAKRLRDQDNPGWISAIEAMEASTERALRVFEELDSPMLHANCLTDSVRLSVAQGLPIDEQRLRKAAAHCIAFGYGGQARRLIELPGADSILSPDDMHGLTKVAHRADPCAIHRILKPLARH